MPDRYAAYPSLELERPADGVLVVMAAPGGSTRPGTRCTATWPASGPRSTVTEVRGGGRGAGDAFSSGGDIDLVADMADDFEVRVRVLREARDLVYNLVNCSKPVVSAGPAVGAGLVIGLLADISVAARSARIIDGHTRLGVAGGDHAAIVWPLLCGMAKAKYHLLLCEPVSGEEAEWIGLVSRCVDDAELRRRPGGGGQAGRRLPERRPLDQVRPQQLAAHGRADLRHLLALEFLGFSGPDVREGWRRSGKAPGQVHRPGVRVTAQPWPGCTTPTSYARITAWMRSRRPSLASTLPTWVLTVCSLTYSDAAISALDSPWPSAPGPALPGGEGNGRPGRVGPGGGRRTLDQAAGDPGSEQGVAGPRPPARPPPGPHGAGP